MISLRTIPKMAARFGRDRDGAAAVEFALLLPIILLFYVCVLEFSLAFMVQRRVAHATSQVADIVAQAGQVNRLSLNGFFDISQLIMTPFDAGPMKTKITSVALDNRGRAIVQWSHARGMPADVPNTRLTIPNGLLSVTGDALIVSYSEYAYDSPFDITIPGFPDFLSELVTFRRTFYLRPREVVSVSCLDCPR